MHSTLKPKQTDDPHDVLVVAPDVVQVAPADQELSKLLHQAAARYRSDPQPPARSDVPAGPMVPPVDTTLPPAAVNHVLDPATRWPLASRALRAPIAIPL